MQIAICDDNEKYCSALEKWILEYARKNIIKINISIFDKPEKLCRHISENQWFDLIFLSNELPGTSGVAVGKYIREVMKDERSNIVYISQDIGCCVDLFEIRPFNFHKKPVAKSSIHKDIEKVIKLSGISKARYSFKYNGVIRSVDLKDIVYFSAEQKLVRLAAVKKSFLFRSNLNEISACIPDRFFCRCHKSFIVNLNYVKVYRHDEFELGNGETIPIGRKYRNQIKELKAALEKGK